MVASKANQKPFTQPGQGVELPTTKKQIYTGLTGLYTVVGRLHDQPLFGKGARTHPQNFEDFGVLVGFDCRSYCGRINLM